MRWPARIIAMLLIFLFLPGITFAAQAKKAKFISCVPYARTVSGVMLRGDAHTWWKSAENKYLRTHQPTKGAVMVMSKTPRLPRGHVAMVSSVLSDREVLLDHANWLNRGQIHKDILAVDVSPKNDWSLVRVWHQPTKSLGWHNYKVSGFILPDPEPVVASAKMPANTSKDQKDLVTGDRGGDIPMEESVPTLAPTILPSLNVGQE